MMKAFSGIGFVVGLALAQIQINARPSPPAQLSNPTSAATTFSAGFIDAGRLSTGYAEIGYLDAGQVWTATANMGFADAGTVWTNFVNAGSIDAGRIGVAAAAIGGMDAGPSYFSADVSMANSPAIPGAAITCAAGAACLNETQNQTDTWNQSVGSGLSITTLWGGIWNNPSHNANFFDGTHSYTGNSTNHAYQIRTNAIGRVTVFGGGNVAIGSQSDNGDMLHVSGGISADGGTFYNALNNAQSDGGTILASTAGPMRIVSGVTDSATAVAHIFDTTTTLANSAAKIASWRNGGSELMYLDKFGNIQIAVAGGVYNTLSSTGFEIRSSRSDGASSVGIILNSNTTLSNAAARLVGIYNGGGANLRYSWDGNGKPFTTFTDSSGSPGNATANTVCGRGAIANGASAMTITNSAVVAASNVFLQLESTGTNASTLVAAPAAGSVVVTNAAAGVATNVTGTTKFSWCVYN